MYNRYIPQSDGTYQRNRIPDPVPRTPPMREYPPEPASIPPCSAAPPPPPSRPMRPCPARFPRREPHNDSSILSFLRKLLPSDFDSSDLLVVLLLLLMSGDCSEDQNSALLTLALYLFL